MQFSCTSTWQFALPHMLLLSKLKHGYLYVLMFALGLQNLHIKEIFAYCTAVASSGFPGLIVIIIKKIFFSRRCLYLTIVFFFLILISDGRLFWKVKCSNVSKAAVILWSKKYISLTSPPVLDTNEMCRPTIS